MYVLVVDDDPIVRKMVKFVLEDDGYEVAAADGSEAALSLIKSRHPDLFILDVVMPKMDGFELCRRIRSVDSNAIILFLTGKGEVDDRVSGLRLGADDYLVKPFEPAEFLARVEALRRRYLRFQATSHATEISAGNVKLHVGELKLAVRSKKHSQLVDVTPTEMKLLRCLMVSAGQVVSRDALLYSIWGQNSGSGDSQMIDVYIRRLRKKIEVDPSAPTLIESIRGIGYKFNSTVPA